MARGGFPSDKQDQFMLRLPDGMRDAIRQVAEAAGRSMNTEIIHRLTQSFEDQKLGRLKIDVPVDNFMALLNDATLRGLAIEDRAVQIIKQTYDDRLEKSSIRTMNVPVRSDDGNLLKVINELVAEVKAVRSDLKARTLSGEPNDTSGESVRPSTSDDAKDND